VAVAVTVGARRGIGLAVVAAAVVAAAVVAAAVIAATIVGSRPVVTTMSTAGSMPMAVALPMAISVTIAIARATAMRVGRSAPVAAAWTVAVAGLGEGRREERYREGESRNDAESLHRVPPRTSGEEHSKRRSGAGVLSDQ